MSTKDVFERNREIDKILDRMRFISVSHLMSKDIDDTGYYEVPRNLERETRRLAVELRILTSRIMSLAFNENDFAGLSNERTEKREQ